MADPHPLAPELLAPAGDETCLRAAIENGADAVYFGLDSGFNARARATNFDVATLPQTMRTLHRQGVKGYVTLNTLAFSSELPLLEDLIRHIAEAGVDAVLVQDFGLARLIRALTEELPIHASTQMTLTSAECLAVAEQLGISRVVLPRELSLQEIREVHEASSIELEAFVHGALCVAYSGQCLTSESLGGRSANRGQCAQACRLPYEIVCDGEQRDFGDQKYLLSPQDLAAFSLTAELIAAGVRSFKIEGRLKTPEYVANITRHYRESIDRTLAGLPVDFTDRQVQQMEQSFSRGFSPGWLQGCDHKMLVPATSSAKRGVLLGTVEHVRHDRVSVNLQYVVRAGDGVVFEGDRAAGNEIGGRVFEVFQGSLRLRDAVDSGVVELTFDRKTVDLSQLRCGQKVWKTDDPRLNAELRRSFTSADPQRRVPLHLKVTAASGHPLVVQGRTDTGSVCHVVSEETLEAATRHPAEERLFREQLSRLGGTVYRLESLECQIDDGPMIPLSLLGRIRRTMVEQLDAKLPVARRRLTAGSVVQQLRSDLVQENGKKTATASSLTVLCRNLSQVRSCLDPTVQNIRPARLLADFQDLREYREAIILARDAGVPLYPATPRIQKPGETGLFYLMQKQQPDGVLIRNLSGLAYFRDRGIPVAGDYSLNITNELSAHWMMSQGLQWLTPSYDLNRDQLHELVDRVPSQWLEVVIHQHMPMFHMEHCVFCAMLSPGTNKTNCGRPCDVHQVELRDRTGMPHPLVADVGCRNTLFNAVAQSAAEMVPQLQQSGIERFRVELLRETSAEVHRLLQMYQALLSGSRTGESVWKSLNALNRVGVTRGTMETRRDPLAIL